VCVVCVKEREREGERERVRVCVYVKDRGERREGVSGQCKCVKCVNILHFFS